MEPTLKVVGGHKSQDHEYDAHAGARCVSCGRARFMNALRLMTGACVGMNALRVMACANFSLLGDRSWFGTMACWFKLVALGAPLASTAGHAMRHEPFLFSSHPPFQGCAQGRWHSGVYGGTLLRGSGALGSYPPLATAHPYASCMHWWCIASLLHPGSSPGGPRTPLRLRGCWVRMPCIFTPSLVETI